MHVVENVVFGAREERGVPELAIALADEEGLEDEAREKRAGS